MPSIVISQSRFDGGEIGPEIEARDDSGKRRAGLAQLKNGYGGFGGAVKKRPGLQYVGHSPSTFDRPRTWTWTGARSEPDFFMYFRPSPFARFNALSDIERALLDLPNVVNQPDWDSAFLSLMTADGEWVYSNVVQNGPHRIFNDDYVVTGWEISSPAGHDELRLFVTRSDGGTDATGLPQQFPFVIGPGNLVVLTDNEIATANRVSGRTFYASVIESNLAAGYVRYETYTENGDVINSGQSGITPAPPFSPPSSWDLNIIGEVPLPWKWADIWQSENNADATNPGLKFVQSGDVMTCTHTSQPVHVIERVPVAELSDTDRRNAPRRESVDAADVIADGTRASYAWRVLPADFSLRQAPPMNIKIANYRPRARNEGFQADAADHVDFAVTAVTEDLGESHPGLAASDSRFFQPENGKRDFLDDWRLGDSRFVAVDSAQAAVLGFDLFADHPGLHIRTTQQTTEGEDIVDKFPPGTACWIGSSRGTNGVEQYVFQVRSVRLEEPTTSDNRAALNASTGGIPGTNRSERGFPGPWIVVHPEPTPEEYENIFSMRTPRDTTAPAGTIEGPEFTGVNAFPQPFVKRLPLNDTPE